MNSIDRTFGPTDLRTIVIAWVVEDFEVVRAGRRDLGERPELKRILVARAAVWLNAGTEEDEEKARAHARKMDSECPPRVYIYSPREPDPLGRAKREILGR